MNSLRIEGQKTVSIEIVQQFDWEVPDWVVIPGGNLGNVSALGKGFTDDEGAGADRPAAAAAWWPRPSTPTRSTGPSRGRLRAAPSVAVPPVTAQKTLASRHPDRRPGSAERALRALQALDGVVEQASEDELADAAARADRAGLFTCPHTGRGAGGAGQAGASAATIKTGERVVVISTAHGLKFSDFKVGYHDETLPGLRRRSATPRSGSPPRWAPCRTPSPPASGRGERCRRARP